MIVRSKPCWSDVEAKLANFDRVRLISLEQAMYAASEDKQAFLHARVELGDVVLKPYKPSIVR